MFKETLFKFNTEEVVYEKIKKSDIVKHYAKIFSVGLTIGVATTFYLTKQSNKLYENIPVIISEYKEEEKPTAENVYKYMKQINLRFPEIVLAQTILESKHYNSLLLSNNNNLLGLKEARQRVTFSTGTLFNHATFKSWKRCIDDYAVYQTKYYSKVETEEQYYNCLLESGYAEDPAYVKKVKQIRNGDKVKKIIKNYVD